MKEQICPKCNHPIKSNERVCSVPIGPNQWCICEHPAASEGVPTQFNYFRWVTADFPRWLEDEMGDNPSVTFSRKVVNQCVGIFRESKTHLAPTVSPVTVDEAAVRRDAEEITERMTHFNYPCDCESAFCEHWKSKVAEIISTELKNSDSGKVGK